MERLRKMRGATRALHDQEKTINHKDKENSNISKKTVEETRKTLKPCTKPAFTTSTAKKLNLAATRRRILSDTALLPSNKKIRTKVTQPQVDAATAVARPPLGDLDKNITKNSPEADTKSNLQKNNPIPKTVRFNNVERQTMYVATEVEETKVTKNLHGSDTNICHTKYTRLIAYKTVQLSCMTTTNIPKSTVSRSSTTTNDRATLNRDVPESSESNKQFNLDRKNITVRKSLTPRPERIVAKDCDSDTNEIFIDSSQRLINCDHSEDSAHNRNKQKLVCVFPLNSDRFISPIKPNVYTSSSTLIFQGIPEKVRRPAKKMTLMHRIQSSRQGNSNVYCLDIYNTEYLEDVVCYQLENDWKYVLKRNFLIVSNPWYNRAAVINWLIQVQDYLDLPQVILFTTIRLFDTVLGSTSIPTNMYQLVGLTTIWIVTKYEDNAMNLQAPKILALCNGAYSIRQLLKMEKKLIAFFNCDLNIPDITVYIMFYAKKLNIEENDLFLQCTFYILECFTLNIEFSTVVPSKQAAAAICLTLAILHPMSKVWNTLEHSLGYYKMEDIDDVMNKMLEQLHQVQDPVYKFRQPYHKYATKEKIQVSMVLLRKLIAT